MLYQSNKRLKEIVSLPSAPVCKALVIRTNLGFICYITCALLKDHLVTRFADNNVQGHRNFHVLRRFETKPLSSFYSIKWQVNAVIQNQTPAVFLAFDIAILLSCFAAFNFFSEDISDNSGGF